MLKSLPGPGFDDQAILEAVATTALGQMLCTLAEALQPLPIRSVLNPLPSKLKSRPNPASGNNPAGPYLKSQLQPPSDFEPFSVLRDQLGFIPGLFRAQMLRPDLVAAEVHFLEQILLSEDVLSRIQKEKILLVVSASNLNTYGVALQRQILDGLGVAARGVRRDRKRPHSASIAPGRQGVAG